MVREHSRRQWLGAGEGQNTTPLRDTKLHLRKRRGGGGEEYYWTNKAPSSERDFISQSTTQTIMTDLVLGRNS